ncbi:type I-E CRISPR-associated protein Cse1/CasA [Nocardia asteroides]|uniref:type I-E CRISPR-associated protein Cse1/CasA n=1 Tax=Nocardia asteroides TaxID=1824 RepID=UPI001E3A9B8A|nr:type I-E CRISPR-associated protein Cse1/CasA [Nocardia asteroides]UGT59941.1 type I-E CRISPR-associated protein Cse1/CasA [Nocardia asteroides]
MTDEYRFDLLDEPWILATDTAGRLREVSLRQVFRDAHELSALAGELPTQEFAILRLLLAILHRSIHERAGTAVEVWAGLWQEWPAAEIDAYLLRYRHRFQLFDANEPFLQVAELRSSKDAVSSLDKVIADIPNGSKYFTTRAGRAIDRIGAAEAARWLVHAHAFDPSGIKTGAAGDDRVKGGRGYPIGIAWAGGLGGVYLEGSNLRQTLLLNLVLTDPSGERHQQIGVPPWERAADGPAVRKDPGPHGPVELLTWQSRRVRLVRDGDEVTGLVLCNGDALEPFNQQLLEPMTAWRYSEIQSKKAGRARHYPLLHDPDRSLWRGLRSLLSDVANSAPTAGRGIAPGVVEWAGLLTARGVIPRTHPIRLHATGMHYINNVSIVGDIIDDAIGFSAAMLADNPALRTCAVNAVQLAEDCVYELGRLAANLAIAAGGETDGPTARAKELGYYTLEDPYRRWLRGLDPHATDLSDSAVEWQRVVGRIVHGLGDELITAAGQPAWVGREANKRWVDSGQADLWFRDKLRELLPVAFTAPATPEKGKATDDERVDVVW